MTPLPDKRFWTDLAAEPAAAVAAGKLLVDIIVIITDAYAQQQKLTFSLNSKRI